MFSVNIFRSIPKLEEKDFKTKSIFDFTVEDIDGKPISLQKYKGHKAYLIVNVASGCDLTKQNYTELQMLYDKYGPSSPNPGLEILAFPCNNFFGLEPGTNSDILKFARNLGAKFPIFGKMVCDNGKLTHALYQYLVNYVPAGNPRFRRGLKWNFTKFLCDRNGIPLRRYRPMKNPLSFEQDIVDLLNEK